MSQFITYHKNQQFNIVGSICIPINILTKSIRDLLRDHNIKAITCYIRKTNNNTSIFVTNSFNKFDRVDIIDT